MAAAERQALLLRRDADDRTLPGTHPALGGARIAWREGDAIVVADAAHAAAAASRHCAPGAGVLAVSDSLLAWRTRDAAGHRPALGRAAGGTPRLLLESPAPPGARAARRCAAAGCSATSPARPAACSTASTWRPARSSRAAQAGRRADHEPVDRRRAGCSTCTRPARTQELRIGPLAARRPARRPRPARPRARPAGATASTSPAAAATGTGTAAELPPRAAPGVVDTLWTTALTSSAAYVTRLHVQRGAAADGGHPARAARGLRVGALASETRREGFPCRGARCSGCSP